MATTVLPSDDFNTNDDDDQHFEIFCLIWLDAHVNLEETRDTEQKLRSIINYLKKFQDINQCQQYIEQRSQKDRLVLIVSGQMGREIVPSIHKLRQIVSIYVYCMDKKRNEEWASKFSKVKAVIVTLDELISRIRTDHQIQKKVEEPLSINIFTTGTTGAGSSTTGVNGQFVFFQVLIDCLLRLKSIQTDKTELIDICKNKYKGNSFELIDLCEFGEDYSSDKALWWYTRESFFYKTLNTALRQPDIHLIFLFRTFISDIYGQLQNYQAKKFVRVYRSQKMSSNELKTLQQSLGQFISVNSFFSTSTDYKKALSFLGMSDASDDFERVVFTIDADPKMVTTKPFADVSEYSYFPDESEILFMLGSIFRLQRIYRNENDEVWIIRMTLCSDDEHDLKQVLMHMKQQIESGDTNLRILGNILWEMGQLDLAEKYLIRLLKQLPPNDSLHISLYEDLGKLASQRHNFDMSLEWRQKSLAFQKENQSYVNIFVSRTKNFLRQQIFLSSPINIKRKWKQHGITIAGGNGRGNRLNQLSLPEGLSVDDDELRIYVADGWNDRIVEWKYEGKKGEVVAGGNGQGKGMHQLSRPTAVMVDQKDDSLIICDTGNRRVVRSSRRHEIKVQIIISGIDCRGLTMDKHGDLYVSDGEKHEVRRWKIGETKGTIVAGGNGQGNQRHQLDFPTHLFVDEHQSVYVSDSKNHRVMKWLKDAKEGMVMAGGQGQGDSLTQLSNPYGVMVDPWGDLYVADCENDRIMCWSKGSKEGSIVVGGNGRGNQPNQLDGPISLSFDGQGHLYVVDQFNDQVQKFVVDDN